MPALFRTAFFIFLIAALTAGVACLIQYLIGWYVKYKAKMFDSELKEYQKSVTETTKPVKEKVKKVSEPKKRGRPKKVN